MTVGFLKSESVHIRADWDQFYPLGQLLGPSDLGQPFMLKADKNRALHSPQQQKFSTSKIKTHQVNRCGCDFLMSSSNSQVESPVL